MAMKPMKYCVVDAFAEAAFKGNPAAVCLLEEDKDNKWLQSVVTEFSMSQTCYLTSLIQSNEANPTFGLRWFTPVTEIYVDMQRLAAAHFLFADGLVKTDTVEFSTMSGILTAKRVAEAKASKSQDDSPTGYSIELDLHDPVCGSSHCALAPYWHKKLGKCDFVALAASIRGGVVNVHLDKENQRVFLRGKALAVMEIHDLLGIKH